MHSRRLTGIWLVVMALVAAPALGGTASASSGDAPVHVAKKHKHRKHKRKKCKAGQVAIKVNRRIVGCRAAAAAIPPPRAKDSRLLLAKAALADNLGGLRDRRGRRPPSLKKVFRRVNRHAYATLQKAIPQGFARLDRLAAASPGAYLRPAAAGATPFARQIPDCAMPGATPPTSSDSFTSKGGGESMTATMTLGSTADLGIDIASGGYSIQMHITTDDCNRFVGPDCPTAAGLIDETDSSLFRVSLAVSKGKDLLVSRSFRFAGQTRMHAEVDEDAKLDFIDIDDTATAHFDLGGSKQQFGPMSLIYTALRRTRVDLPAGTYSPGHSVVDIAFTTGGVTVGKSDIPAVANSTAKELDESFGALVNKEISNFRKLETDWNAPNQCAKIEFAAAPRTLKLRRNDTGSFTAKAVAVQDGGASAGRWTRTSQANANVTPDHAEGANPQFSYTVTNDGKDVLVTTTIHATSRAGVAEDSWVQETTSGAFYTGQIDGTFDFVIAGQCGAHLTLDYHSRVRDFFSDSPFDLSHLGGIELTAADTGTGSYVVDACEPDSPGCTESLEPTSPDEGTVILESFLNDPNIHAEVTTSSWRVTGGDCDNPFNGFVIGNGTFPITEVGNDTITMPFSINETDGNDTSVGSGTLTLHRET